MTNSLCYDHLEKVYELYECLVGATRFWYIFSVVFKILVPKKINVTNCKPKGKLINFSTRKIHFQKCCSVLKLNGLYADETMFELG